MRTNKSEMIFVKSEPDYFAPSNVPRVKYYLMDTKLGQFVATLFDILHQAARVRAGRKTSVRIGLVTTRRTSEKKSDGFANAGIQEEC